MAARNLAGPTSGGLVGVPTSKRLQIIQDLRIPSRILKGASHKEVVDYVVAEVAMPKVGRR
jgi:hypothetical protein